MAVKFKNTININDQYTFPTTVGTDGQYLSVTDAAAGQLDWTNIGDVDGLKSNFVYYDAKNSTGSTIPVGTAVMAVGTDGNSGHVLIAPMVSDGSVEPKFFIGVTDTAIANGVIGKVVHFGTIDQVNTGAFSDGDILWCDPATAGGFTITEPLAPNVKIAAAIVINSSTNGKLLVRVQGNEGLHELHDVRITSATDGQALVWDATGGYWKNDNTVNSVTAGNGISVDASTGDITITNSSPDQTVSLTSGTGISTSGTYPDFTITNTSPDQTVSLTAGTGISTSGTYPDFTITNSAPDQTVSISGTGAASVTGTYPNFTIDVEESTGGTTTIQKNVFTGNGSQTTFTLQSPITSETQTQVYIDGVYQSKDNYSVSGSNVIFSTSPDSGTSIEIIHIVSVSAVINRETFIGDGVEVDFTLSSEVSSENNTQIYIDGVYQSKDNYTTSGQVITFSTAPDDGVEIEVVHIKTTETTQINSNQLVGDGSTTNFTLSQAVDSKDKSFVFIQGVYQEKSTYTLSGTSLSFTTAPQVGYTIEVVTFSALSVANDTLFLNNFTGNGSTVDFDLSSVPASENAVDVYINGVYQEKSTFAISGSVLTFTTAPPSGYSVEVKSTGGLKNVVSGSVANYDAFVITSNTQAQKNRVYVLDDDLTLTLPLSPSNGDSIKISNLSGAANCVIARNGENIMGIAEDLTLDNPNFNFELIYTGAAKGWVII